MKRIDIDEIISAMLEKSDEITWYLDKVNGNIVYVDENIASEVDEKYEEAETAIEEWSADLEDDNIYQEEMYAADDEDTDEKELIKRIRYTKQEDYEPIPRLTLSDLKDFARNFVNEVQTVPKENLDEVINSIRNCESEDEIEQIIIKEVGEKEKWFKYNQDVIRDKAINWLSLNGFRII